MVLLFSFRGNGCRAKKSIRVLDGITVPRNTAQIVQAFVHHYLSYPPLKASYALVLIDGRENLKKGIV